MGSDGCAKITEHHECWLTCTDMGIHTDRDKEIKDTKIE